MPVWQLCYCMGGFPQQSVRALLRSPPPKCYSSAHAGYLCSKSVLLFSLFSLIIKCQVFLWLFPYILSFGWPLALYYLNCFFISAVPSSTFICVLLLHPNLKPLFLLWDLCFLRFGGICWLIRYEKR